MASTSQNLTSQNFRGNSLLPLGMRNNNPGNLRSNALNKWVGKIGENRGFDVFSEVHFGIRAWLIDYYADVNRKKLDTLRKYINAYAPATENNVTAYLASLKAQTGLLPDSPMPTDKPTVKKLMRAIFIHENNQMSVNQIKDTDIEAAFDALPTIHKAFFLSAAKRVG